MSQDLERQRPRDRKKRRRWRRWRISIRQALALSVLIHAAVLAIRLEAPALGFAKPWAERRLQAPDISRSSSGPRPSLRIAAHPNTRLAAPQRPAATSRGKKDEARSPDGHLASLAW